MKKKIKRLDKKDISDVENNQANDSIESSDPTIKKDWRVKVVKTIAYILIAIILFLGLLSGVFAAEGYFGDPDEWTWRDSRMMMQLALAGGVGILYLASKVEEKIKKWINKKR